MIVLPTKQAFVLISQGNFFQNIGSIALFAVFGTAISAFIVGGGIYFLGQVSINNIYVKDVNILTCLSMHFNYAYIKCLKKREQVCPKKPCVNYLYFKVYTVSLIKILVKGLM